ncbi:hypothetical protein [Mariniluteicoccus flavus]
MSTHAVPAPSPTPLARVGWGAHLALRLGVAFMLFVYGWTKVFTMQMGRSDFGDALINHGEMSPMGLLWRWMGFSPAVQVIAGAAEVAAAGLLLWRRTALVGALLGAADMAVVFGFNLAYDVPVKQLSLMLTLGCVIIALPYAPRLVRALFTRGPVAAGPLPTLVDGRAGRVTNVLGLLTALALTVASGVVFWSVMGSKRPTEVHGPLVGVHRVARDSAAPAPQLADDARWQHIAFGQWKNRNGARVTVRQANGDLRVGTYRVTSPDRVTIALQPVLRGDAKLNQKPTDTLELRFAHTPDGVRLVGAGQDLVITPDHERRYLFDRRFSWGGRGPVNR